MFKSKPIELLVYGPYGLFTDPLTRIGGEKSTYQIPTYEALKGVMASIYWKPTIIWVIDTMRVMNPIRMETKGMRPIIYNAKHGGLASYTYLKACRYQVKAHFEWNMNRPDRACDRSESKHMDQAMRALARGGRRDVFLGTRECQAYVEPCAFGEGAGAYDDVSELSFGLMFHGMTYADEAYSDATRGHMTARFWRPVMTNGIVTFCRPEDCPLHKTIRPMAMKCFPPPADKEEDDEDE